MQNLQHRPFSRTEETLRKATRLVDDETGIIRLIHEAPTAPDAPKIFGCGSLCSDFSNIGYPSDNPISGSTSLVRDKAIAGAIGEAVERYSAAYVPYDKIIVKPYSSINDGFIEPWSLTLYDNDQYNRPNFGYHPVMPDDPIGWVIGHSLTTGSQILVPAFSVYQPYISQTGELPAVQQITTGLACGNTLEEAVLAAICEVVERDAAILMWLQRRRPPRVITEFKDGSLVSAVFRAFGNLKNCVTILDVTTDLGIPSYVAVWDGPIDKEHGAIFASCAKLSPERAVIGALAELAQCMMWVGSLLDNRKHIADPRIETISRIEEHVLWPLRPSCRPLYEFALSSKRQVRLSDWPDASNSDVLQSIENCVTLIAAQGLEVIAVDVTAPDVREAGLSVVRVIIPGSQPLFFGTGSHRISKRARTTRYPDCADEALNLHPHPFP